MSRTIKVYCTGPDQDKLGDQYRLIEKYQGFALAEVPEQEVEQLSRRYPVEDITNLYVIRLGDRIVDTSQRQGSLEAKSVARRSSKGAKPLAPGKHHYLVQFVGPIKEEWLAAVKKAGGEIRAPYGDFNYVVRTDEKKLTQIAALPFVRWVGRRRTGIESIPPRFEVPQENPRGLPRCFPADGSWMEPIRWSSSAQLT